ncbi:MAG: antitoxin [Candidatus Fischerbacteria bacterium RBG_13_37_8]|uniref:Antitoxin n=1 Tax=Candidatus Fischerbacteria bacterium RBG_13_37_8 TaxID=1817863 RepID=A0A1F5VDU9_9BACT|nr:MAG: antitoxin [Candidatus Fischerbacteria bacterium RBG_13_37_8]
MATKVNIHEAKTQFSRLIARMSNGEEIIITKAGKPIARLVPITKKPKDRIPGSAKGKIMIRKDFDVSLPDSLQKEFES